ncbi:MAG: hypothetical protein AAGD14_09285 [Planctomycetota bacterium]
MRELDAEYGEKVRVEVTSIRQQPGQEVSKAYDFTPSNHGLVYFGKDGKVAFVRPGHRYSKDDIKGDVDGLLNP